MAEPLSQDILDAAAAGDLRAFTGLTDEDVTVARAVNRDLCLTAGSLVGRAVRIVADCMAKGIPLEKLAIPYVCQKCLIDALPDLVADACGTCPPIVRVADWPVASASFEADGAGTDTGDAASVSGKPLIGIVGTAPLVFEPCLNDTIGRFIESQGFQPVWPAPENLMVEDVRYADQLDDFAQQGVSHVIYLQSFGCLKGHMASRGNANAFAARYPDMPITARHMARYAMRTRLSFFLVG